MVAGSDPINSTDYPISCVVAICGNLLVIQSQDCHVPLSPFD